MVSHERLLALPEVENLRRLSQSLAVLDAVMSPDWENWYYSFNSKWADGEMVASMRNGSGDGYFILFNPAGAIIKGFDHESAMSPYAGDEVKVWPGALDEVPEEFGSFLSEPAFTIEDVTFCIWRRYADPSWRTGTINYPGGDEDAEGSGWMLSILSGDPAEYQEFAEGYYERPVDLDAVRHVYRHEPLTEGVVRRLNAEWSLEELVADLEEIGYPGGIT